MRYEVLQISRYLEAELHSFADLDDAFDNCLGHWRVRKAGSPVYVVRDAETDQRWSYADINDLRTAASQDGCSK